MAQSDLRPVAVIGPPGGIDQSANPKPRTVRDCCNIDTSRGIWENRPGLRSICQPLTPSNVGNLLVEYVPDRRFATSHYKAIICGCVDHSSQTIKEVMNPEEVNTLTGHGQTEGWWKRFAVAKGLWRYDKGETAADGTMVDPDYTPVIVLSNGYDPPILYHQKDGGGALSNLDAIEGDYASMGYLKTPPCGKVMAIFKERLFMANTPKGGNIVQWTSSINMTMTVNVWPAPYFNFLGSGDEEITALIQFKDQLVVFKKNSIYTISGEGVEGKWQWDLVDNQHGAASTHCVVNTGNALFFLAKDGIYIWAGGRAKCISHPRIKDLWNEMDWTEGKLKRFYAVHDSLNHLVFFACGQTSQDIDSAIVYDYTRDAWSRWGAWPGKHRDVFPYAFPNWASEIPNWNDSDSKVLSIYHGYLCCFKRCHDIFDTDVTITAGNKWIDIDDGGGEDNCSIAEGVYNNLYAVAAAVQAAIRTGTGDATFTVKYSAPARKFTIARTGLFDILWNTGVNTGNTVGTTLGFSVAADDTGAGSYLADNCKDISTNYAIHWFLRTQKYFEDDSFHKVLRHGVISAKKTGEWKMLLLAIKDSEGVEDALRRQAGTKHNVIVDSLNAVEHEVNGISQFQTADDGPVDIFDLKTFHKDAYSKHLVTSSGATKIKFFLAPFDSTGKAGDLLVLPEGVNPRRTRDMYDNKAELYGAIVGYGTYDDAAVRILDFEKQNMGTNVTGRGFSLLMTNVGEYSGGVGFDFAKKCSLLRMNGWELWVVPTRRLRPMG